MSAYFCPFCGKPGVAPLECVVALVKMGESEGTAEPCRCAACGGEFWANGPEIPESSSREAAEPEPEKVPSPLRVAVKFGGYNARRYGKPWIARVASWPVGGQPDLLFGSYVGDSCGGEAEVPALPGDIVRWGQKDHRGSRSEAFFGVVLEDGTIEKVSPVKARGLFENRGR